MPPSHVMANAPPSPIVARLSAHSITHTTLVAISQSSPNPALNPSSRSASMPSMNFLNAVGNQYFPSMSYTIRSPYVPILHNISRTTPPVVGFSGYDHVPQPPAYSSAQPQYPYVSCQ